MFVHDDPMADCRGSATECDELADTRCLWQDGCRLEPNCIGEEWPCDYFTGERVCSEHTGCTWTTDVCDGYVTDCDDLTTDECEEQAGCRLIRE